AGGVADCNTINLLSQWQSAANNLLSYDLQVKVKVDAQGSHGKTYMEGLSFRFGEDNHTTSGAFDSTFGVSFYRRDCSGCPAWNDTLTSSGGFNVLTDQYVYLVLWRELQGTYKLLDYKKLTTSDGVVSDNNSGATLNDWSTILVSVVETLSGTKRYNNVYVYTASASNVIPPNTTVYQKAVLGGTINWTYAFRGSTWTNYSANWSTNPTFASKPNYTYLTSPNPYIIDDNLTTVNFATYKPPEIGIHDFYDSNAANDAFFADFAMRLNAVGAANTVIAYY
ncbi:MAG: hypothetical protein L7F77_03570, partial [Candidatus Magnetominusculus sp. LBB02]|nr:hypothetical protein [Candidatus Magnetominusculus sp. LBB02]